MTVQSKLVIKLFLLMGLGAFLRKRNIITEEGKAMLTDLILKIVLPCSILSSFLSKTEETGSDTFIQMLLLSLGLQIFSFFVSFLLYRKCDPKHRTVLQYGTICSNSGILGTPIATELFGAPGGLLASVYLLPLRIAMWTAGLSLFTRERNKSILAMALHPCVVATLAGMALFGLNLDLPKLLSETITTVGRCNTFLSLALVGGSIADMDPKGILDRDAFYYTGIRLIALPVLVWAVSSVLRLDSFVCRVAVILTAMPAGATTTILAFRYHKDASFAAACTALSTAVSLIAIPIWYVILCG